MKKILALIPVALWATGCAQYQIVNRSNPSANWSVDVYECNNQAAQRFPPNFVTYTETKPTAFGMLNPPAINTSCTSNFRGSVDCTSTANPNPLNLPTHTTTQISVDRNAQNRTNFAEQCLAAKGWTKELVKKEKADYTAKVREPAIEKPNYSIWQTQSIPEGMATLVDEETNGVLNGMKKCTYKDKSKKIIAKFINKESACPESVALDR